MRPKYLSQQQYKQERIPEPGKVETVKLSL
jgi:hypothetical protein